MNWSDCLASFNFFSVQEKIGYNFRNQNLLRQAFTSPSVTTASDGKIQNYQVLEFIGDSVLEMIVVKELSDDFCYFDKFGQMICKTNEGKLTEMKVGYVKNETLAHCAEVLGLNQYMERVYSYSSSDFKNKRGDLIEAILGAVALDSNWNLGKIASVANKILSYKNVDIDYSSQLERFCNKRRIGEPFFRFTDDGSDFICYVSIPNAEKVFTAKGSTEIAAQNEASKEALKFLKFSGEEKKFAAKIPDDENPISKLNLMYQKKIISKPVYDLKFLADGKREYWECEASLENDDYVFCAEGNSKQEAKKIAATSLLDYVSQEDFSKDNIIVDSENVVRGKGLFQLIMSKYKNHQTG